MLALIYARSRNHCIGRDGRLPWRLPDEFAHFKRTTMGCPILMGRKTYEDHDSALPGRTNIVITRQPDYANRVAPGVLVADALQAAIELARAQSPPEVFVIGGAGLLQAAFPQAQTVYETVVDAHIEGDTFLQPFDFTAWRATPLINHPADTRHDHAFVATRYDRPA